MKQWISLLSGTHKKILTMIQIENEPNRNKKLRIAFISAQDANNKKSFSGTIYYSMQSLARHCGDIEFLGPYRNNFLFTLLRGASFIVRKITGKRYKYLHAI